jgi:uncharacterized protein DUF397
MAPATVRHTAAAPTGWRKSSYSTAGNDCVEVARTDSTYAVRDSKDPQGGYFTVTSAAWKVFTSRIKRGAYDL